MVSPAQTIGPGTVPDDPDTLVLTRKDVSKREVPQMKKLPVLASPAVDAVIGAALLAGVCAALFAGKDDIRRFWRIRKMDR